MSPPCGRVLRRDRVFPDRSASPGRHALSAVAPHLAEQQAADRAGGRALAGIARNGADKGTFCRTRHKILASGGALARLLRHAAEQCATNRAGRGSLAGIAGDTADALAAIESELKI